ncbi:MAG: ATP-binding protein [Lachnospiraceae bacterium]|nr:ATP-binding protein [Lachnospiraceae bacterium]
MERLLMQELIKWKDSKRRKPLILWGARQVGKTWLMQEFGKRFFENTVYISFYNNKKIADIFEKDYDTKRIINALEIELHQKIDKRNTLLIFDEVQSAHKVVESLKYFCEEAGEYAVVAAGSLLGVTIHKDISFPVGKVDEMHLYPMNFREFLLACGEDKLAEYCIDASSAEVSDFSERYKELLKTYYCVGGMPEAVKVYTEENDLAEVRKVQLAILQQYEGDFGKHVSPNELPRIRMVWNSLPTQLAKENKKFFFGQIKQGARQKDFEVAIEWLLDAGLVYKVFKVTKPAMPLKSYVDFSAFKIFMIDVGLLSAFSELDTESVMRGNNLFTEFKGALTEQYVLQQLVSDTKYTPYYYSGEKSVYEVDFLIQKGSDIIPLEVKAEDNLKSKSLKYFYDKFKPGGAIRTSTALYREQEWMKNIPLWAICSV